MSRRIKMGPRIDPRGSKVDATLYVFMCPLCPWQVQAGYAARRDFGLDGLLEAIAAAHMDHILQEHAARDVDDELEWADGSTHSVAKVAAGSRHEGALIATPLPRSWVDR